MRSFKLGSAQIKSNRPITDEEIRAKCPAILAEHRYEGTSDKYTFIPLHQNP